MASQFGYATATQVRRRLKDIQAAPTLTDAEIDDFISAAEGTANALLGASVTWAAATHGAIRSAVVARAAFDAASFEPGGWASVTEFSSVMDMVWEEWSEFVRLCQESTSFRAYLLGRPQ